MMRYAIALLVLFGLAVIVHAIVEKTDLTVIVPNENGTSLQGNVTQRAQQFVGFYGRIEMQVRRTTALGDVMYNKTVQSGRLYFVKETETPVFASTIAALTDAATDGNFSLTGDYITSKHWDAQYRVCGIDNVNFLNTTDGFEIGLFNDAQEDATKYYLCVNIKSVTSQNGFGAVQYEMIAPKTPLYLSYDVWYDLEAGNT